MPSFRVVLVNPKIDGNVGAVARVMGNFGFRDLFLVDPCELTDEAYKRAKHASHLLDEATVVTSLDGAVGGCSSVVGTTGIATPGDKHFIRIAMSPREFASRMESGGGRVALLFGREDLGLFQEELQRCDMLVHIPASEEYPVLNLSHAVAIILYEFHLLRSDAPAHSEADEVEREKLNEFFSDLLDAIDYPRFRRERTEIMFRRLMGRAVPTKWEFHTLMGILGGAARRIRERR